MLDMITQALPGTPVYVQSITPVRPEAVSYTHLDVYKRQEHLWADGEPVDISEYLTPDSTIE